MTEWQGGNSILILVNPPCGRLLLFHFHNSICKGCLQEFLCGILVFEGEKVLSVSTASGRTCKQPHPEVTCPCPCLAYEKMTIASRHEICYDLSMEQSCYKVVASLPCKRGEVVRMEFSFNDMMMFAAFLIALLAYIDRNNKRK